LAGFSGEHARTVLAERDVVHAVLGARDGLRVFEARERGFCQCGLFGLWPSA
jgi:hypothetical protein